MASKTVVTCDICGDERQRDAGWLYGGSIEAQRTNYLRESFWNVEVKIDFCDKCFKQKPGEIMQKIVNDLRQE